MEKLKSTLILKTLATLLVMCCSICLSAQEWEELGEPPFYKHHSNGFGYNGKAYIMEGSNDGDFQLSAKGVWEYNPETDTWTALDDFPGLSRGFAIGDDWDGKYYYGFGGRVTSDIRFNDLWVFDPEDKSFTELPSCPCIGRIHPALIAHNDKIYMGAGGSANGDLQDWWVYDILTQEWEQLPNIPGGNRHHPYHFAIGDNVYVGGGHRGNWLQYDPALNQWTEIDNLPSSRVAGTQFNFNNKGYVLAGDITTHAQHVPNLESFLGYDAETNEWEEFTPLPNGGRWAPSSFIIGTDLYFFGGINYLNAFDRSMFKFDLTAIDDTVLSNNNISDEENTIYAFPNPVIDKLSFGGEFDYNDRYQLSILNVEGKTVYLADEFYPTNELDLSDLPQGIYMLQLINETASIQLKIVKENRQ